MIDIAGGNHPQAEQTMAVYVNVREYRKGNQIWTIQRNWQHRKHKTKKNKIKTQHDMCWTPLYVNKHK